MAPLILITGATGHLGFRTLVLLLQHGYRARVAHRRPEQIDTIRKTQSVQPFLNSIEFALIPDLTAPGAYDEAIKDVDGVIHIASPIPAAVANQKGNWRELFYDPAEQGTLRILTASLQEPKVRRVVITSSVVILEPKNGSDSAGPYDLLALPDPQTMDSAPNDQVAYLNSKVLSHITATKFAEQHPGHFDLIRILPAYIQGANELLTSASQLSDPIKAGSNEGVMTTALGKSAGFSRITAQVLLDDVAKAHVLALQPEVAKNGDNLLVMGNGGRSQPWSDYVPIIERLFPEAVEDGRLTPAAPDESILLHYDVESSEKALGYKFAGPEEMVQSVVGQYLDLLKSNP